MSIDWPARRFLKRSIAGRYNSVSCGPDFNNSVLLFRINFEGRIKMSDFITKKKIRRPCCVNFNFRNKQCLLVTRCSLRQDMDLAVFLNSKWAGVPPPFFFGVTGT